MNREIDRTITNVVLTASVASILLAIYLYGKGEKQSGIFVGLWAPTIMGLGSFLRSTEREPAAALAEKPLAPVA